MLDIETQLRREAETLRANRDAHAALAPQPLRRDRRQRQLGIMASLAASVLVIGLFFYRSPPNSVPEAESQMVKNEQAYQEFSRLTQETVLWAQQISFRHRRPGIVHQLRQQLQSDRDTLRRLFTSTENGAG